MNLLRLLVSSSSLSSLELAFKDRGGPCKSSMSFVASILNLFLLPGCLFLLLTIKSTELERSMAFNGIMYQQDLTCS